MIQLGRRQPAIDVADVIGGVDRKIGYFLRYFSARVLLILQALGQVLAEHPDARQQLSDAVVQVTADLLLLLLQRTHDPSLKLGTFSDVDATSPDSAQTATFEGANGVNHQMARRHIRCPDRDFPILESVSVLNEVVQHTAAEIPKDLHIRLSFHLVARQAQHFDHHAVALRHIAILLDVAPLDVNSCFASDGLVEIDPANSLSDRFYKRSITLFSETRSEEHTSELQSRGHLVCRLLLEKQK